ncbi:SAM-dependent methyltransferase [Nocardia yamanashiensis]|uniref:SAM-dependent methyltransferase n=1 Tax=Nocardia yamanashiensis TaxID=209247 RepID=UPI001E3ED91A|nr:SAM-dependent methyltransferase [Nocardia yamanashiensis]UGT45334.1 SAM-dependent methyltransferase [Nocardia yamanashiensis]
MSEAKRVPVGVDPTKPNAARLYNYLLGGKDNYEVDQAAAQRMLLVAPDTRTQAWFSRKFLLGAVKFAAEEGILQFIDVGAGIPISPNVHEVAQEIQPAARVVSIDYDPVVHVHSNALLSGTKGVTTMLADVRRIDELIARLRDEEQIDFAQPVAILIVGVLHFVMDDEHPEQIFDRFLEVMAPGSVLAFTHASTTTQDEFIAQSKTDLVRSSAQAVFRTPDVVASFIEGYEQVEPGLVKVQEWLGDDLPDTNLVLLAAILRPGRRDRQP